ncbi:MAG: ABC transporter substrate-binding protein [Deltaproteobacteria bacterium]|jgi:branched-chain amino acid transport system substrate-binding protein
MSKQRKHFLYLLLALAIVAILLPTGAVAAETIKVGILLPLSGPLGYFGEMEKQSFDLALEEINGGGGIKGSKLDFIYQDTKGDIDAAREAVKKLMDEDKVVMLGGGYYSPATFSVAGLAQQNRIPFLINTASDDKITEQGWDYVFRLNPPGSEYTSGIESFLREVVKPKTAVIIHEDSVHGRNSAKFFRKTCDKLGIQVLMTEGYQHGVESFKNILTRVKELNPDIVYMCSYVTDGSTLMIEARQMKITPKIFLGGATGFTMPEFVQYAGIASEMVMTATLWHQALPLPGSMAYFTRFTSTYNKEPDYHGAEAYAAAYVIKDVVKRAASFAPDDIKKSLENTRLKTVFGPVHFTSYGNKINQNKLTSYVVQWQFSRLKLIWPRKLANADYVYPVNWLSEWGY